MILNNQKTQKILTILLRNPNISSSQIHSQLKLLGEEISLVTVKKQLSKLVDKKFLTVNGAGRSTSYDISTTGRVVLDINAHDYCLDDPDKRPGLNYYNFNLFTDFPESLFGSEEENDLQLATKEYHLRTTDLPASIQKKELQRLIIELAWKSSKIEGNTYSLLDTEKLIVENIVATDKTRDETTMILNHKDAFEYTRNNTTLFKNLKRSHIEELHKTLVKNLGVGYGVRKKLVGITGSIYRPLDNQFQITEALNSLIVLINRLKSPYAKAMIAVLGISYIQPFEDGNKRTGRLLANAILMAHNLSPLSYRSTDERDYREATLVFYEVNSIMPFKNIFVEQYKFATKNYAVK